MPVPSASIATDKFRISNAQSLLSDIANNNYYLSIGKTTQWANDISPEIPEDSTYYRDNLVWFDMIGTKKVSSTKTSLVTPRYEWTANTIYAQYDSNDGNLFSKQFFVHAIQSDGSYNIYKCLENKNASPSTVLPTDQTTSGDIPARLADGYIWKFMGKINTLDYSNFATPQHMPIKTIATNDGSLQYQIQQSAINGSVLSVHAINIGSGYTSVPTLTIVGDGTGLTVSPVLEGNTITSYNVLTAGQNYSYVTITVSGGGGAGATAKAALSPAGGHGKNAIYELGAYFIMIYVSLEYAENDTLTVNNSYRRVGLIKNPLLLGTSTPATGLNYRQTTRYNITTQSGAGFQINEKISQAGTNGATAYIVDIDATNGYLYVTETGNRLFNVGTGSSQITGQTSGTTSFFSNANSGDAIGLQPESGITMYIENRKPVGRASDQLESIRAVFQL